MTERGRESMKNWIKRRESERDREGEIKEEGVTPFSLNPKP